MQETENNVAGEVQSGNTRIGEKKNASHLWQPGISGNPSGRPKIKRISDAYAAILDEHGATALAERVYCDALTAKNPSDRLAAVQEMTDRVEGKAVQTTRIEQALDGQTARVLADLASRLMPVPERPLLGTSDPSDPDQ